MATDLLGQGADLVGIGGGGGFNGSSITIFLLVIGFVIVGGFCAFLIIMRKQFKYNAVIFERVDGRFKVTGKDRAKKIKLGGHGDEIFQLQKRKKVLPMPTIQTGNNTYWYFISDDGEWINFGPGDFDENRREVGAQFLDKEMRYARSSLEYAFRERYDGPDFWQKYGGLVAYTALILVTAIGFWLLIDKMVDVAGTVKGAVDSAAKVLEATERLLGAADNVQSGGSGFIVG